MNTSWVKLNRRLFDNELWHMEPFSKAQAWVDIFGNANHRETLLSIRGNVVKVKRGQLGWSELTMSKRWKWSRQKVRNFLDFLIQNDYIRQQKNAITSIITVIKYEQYQEGKTTEENELEENPQKTAKSKTAENESNTVTLQEDLGTAVVKKDNKKTTETQKSVQQKAKKWTTEKEKNKAKGKDGLEMSEGEKYNTPPKSGQQKSKKTYTNKNIIQEKKEYIAEASSAGGEKKKFDWERYLTGMEEHPTRRDLQVIGFYFREKGLKYDTQEQAHVAIKRHARAASALKVFSDKQILDACRIAKREYPERFTIETLVKVLTR